MCARVRPQRTCPSRNLHLMDESRFLFIPGVSLVRPVVTQSGQLDQVRCPRCRAHLVARIGRRGPYFHCRCPRPTR
jgi:hypothetical protein